MKKTWIKNKFRIINKFCALICSIFILNIAWFGLVYLLEYLMTRLNLSVQAICCGQANCLVLALQGVIDGTSIEINTEKLGSFMG